MEKTIVKNLLDRVSDINKKYAEIAKITGESFNIFRILKIEANEVRTHSAFIAELLDTFGSHGHGDIFLQLFLNQQREKQKSYPYFLERFEKFDESRSTVTIEKNIGFKNEEETEGGRIDILLSDFKNAIIIENKIYAGDQPKQLVRYQNAYKKAPIFYLTLNGEMPSSDSSGSLEEGKNFICISYKIDIKEWLEACVKQASGYPLLRETIQQYIFLINHLTNQTNNYKMKNEIANIVLEKAETLDAYFNICSVKSDIQNKILEKLHYQLKTLANDNSLELDYEINSNFTKNLGFSFTSDELNQQNLFIYFQFGKNEFQELDFGYCWKIKEKATGINGELLKGTFENKFGIKPFSNDTWPAFVKFNGYADWNDETFKKIYNGDFVTLVQQKVKVLLEIIK